MLFTGAEGEGPPDARCTRRHCLPSDQRERIGLHQIAIVDIAGALRFAPGFGWIDSRVIASLCVFACLPALIDAEPTRRTVAVYGGAYILAVLL